MSGRGCSGHGPAGPPCVPPGQSAWTEAGSSFWFFKRIRGSKWHFQRAARRVRYAWRPTATRVGARRPVAAARPPARIHGAIPSPDVGQRAVAPRAPNGCRIRTVNLDSNRTSSYQSTHSVAPLRKVSDKGSEHLSDMDRNTCPNSSECASAPLCRLGASGSDSQCRVSGRGDASPTSPAPMASNRFNVERSKSTSPRGKQA